MFADILNRGFYNNRVFDYLLCLAIFAGGVFLVGIVKALATRRLKSGAAAVPTRLDEFVHERIRRTAVPLAYLGIAELSLRSLTLNPRFERIIDMAGIVLMSIFGILFAVALVRFGVLEYVRRQGEDPSRDRVLKAAGSLVNVLAWIVGVLFMLDNLGFRISTVVAGLGIGGIAVALAAQAVLGDMFAYFTILFDRPFEIGDHIAVGEHTGTIERFGIKTTRIVGPGGEQIIIPNKDLTGSRVRNFKRTARQRAAFRLGVAYRTPAEKLREIPGIIADIFGGIDGATLDRAHLASCGDFGLIYEIAYHVEGNVHARHTDIQQELNLRICEEFEKREIEFACPTQIPYPNKA